MGAPSLREDADDRRDEDAAGGGMIGPAGGNVIRKFVPPPQARVVSCGPKKKASVSSGEVFRRLYKDMSLDCQLLQEQFASLLLKQDWRKLLDDAERIYALWIAVAEGKREKELAYEDYLAMRQTMGEVETLKFAVDELAIALDLRSYEIKNCRRQYSTWEPTEHQQRTERRAAELLAVWYRIEAMAGNLD